MVRRTPFVIIYAPQVKSHLAAISGRFHSLIRKTIEEQLLFEADIETRNRKPLLREVEFEADWELRLGADNRFRVFYGIDGERHRVEIVAIGEKRGNRLFIANKEIQL